jgi:excisionase family DNA binding protein
MPGPDELPQLLTIDELAERLGVTHRHVRRLVDESRVPYLKVGRLVRFNPAEVAEWLRSQSVPSFANFATSAPVSEGPTRVGPDETRSTSEQ